MFNDVKKINLSKRDIKPISFRKRLTIQLDVVYHRLVFFKQLKYYYLFISIHLQEDY